MIRAWLRADWIDRAGARAAFERPGQPLIERLHVAAGCAWCAMLAGKMTMVEIAAAGPGLMFLVSMFTPKARGTLKYLAVQPLVWMLAAWVAWSVLTLAWSPDPRRGIDQIGTVRFALVMLTLWPVMGCRRWFIGAMAAGFLALNLGQAVSVIGHRAGVAWLELKIQDGRYGGWLPAVYAGEMLVAALGLHLPAALMGRGRARWFARAACVATLAGIVASGTRGAWISAAGLVVIAGLVGAWRWRSGSSRAAPGPGAARGLRIVLAAVVTLLIAGAGVAIGPLVVKRVGQVRDEIARAIDTGDFDSDNGARLMMAAWAWRAFTENPVRGIGVGGFLAWVGEHHEARHEAVWKRIEAVDHGHCHNGVLQAAATMGVPGVALLVSMAGCAIWWAFAGLGRERLGTYDAGPAFALIGLALLWPFDAIYVNAQPSAVLFTLLALSQAWRPRQSAEIDGGPSLPATRSM